MKRSNQVYAMPAFSICISNAGGEHGQEGDPVYEQW
jgi:hypothetical protein